MKTFFCTLLCLLLLTGCAGNSASGLLSNISLDGYLMEIAGELTGTLNMLATSNEYIELFTTDAEVLNRIGEMPSAQPAQQGLLLYFNADMAGNILGIDGADIRGLPAEVHPHLWDKVFLSIPARINAFAGTANLAATSIMTARQDYRGHQTFSGNAVVALLYPDSDYAVFVILRTTQLQMIDATASYVMLPDEMREAIQQEELSAYLSDTFSFHGISPRYYSADELTNP